MATLDEDIEHLKEVLQTFDGCDECKADHERLLGYLEELKMYRSRWERLERLERIALKQTGKVIDCLVSDAEKKI